MVVVSEPHRELVLNGQNHKYVKDCKQMYLGDKGIEKIRNFEEFVNLESLWLNNNKLKKLNNLDNNVRIKVLYAQDNQICTLRGSLLSFKFLEELDLSNNQLRDLEKIVKVLERFQFLTHLNLKGNPCCEEPDYRLHVIHHIPSLRVLDQHVITVKERTKAKALIGGDVATLTVAFGKRALQYDPKWDEKTPERSILEQELIREADNITNTREEEAARREAAFRALKPYTEYGNTRGKSLPPNAGTQRAMELWNTQTAASHTQHSTSVTQACDTTTSDSDKSRGDLVVLYSLRPHDIPEYAATRLAPNTLPGSIKFNQGMYESFAKRKTAGAGHWELTKTITRL